MKIRTITAAAFAGLALAAGAAPAAASAADGHPVYHDTYTTKAECHTVGKEKVGSGNADGYYCEQQEAGWDLYLTYWV
jgi:ABC-type sugar transport system substrate-binding protein